MWVTYLGGNVGRGTTPPIQFTLFSKMTKYCRESEIRDLQSIYKEEEEEKYQQIIEVV